MTTVAVGRLLRNAKRRLAASLTRKVRPHLWQSGFVEPFSEPRKHVNVYAFEKPLTLSFVTKGLDSIDGFTDGGVITDAFGGGLVTCPLSDLAVEDLVKIARRVSRYGLPKPMKRNPPKSL